MQFATRAFSYLPTLLLLVLNCKSPQVVEDMTAEERLMRNVPKSVTKLIIFHPAKYEPVEIQEFLTKMTNTYCYKSVGK